MLRTFLSFSCRGYSKSRESIQRIKNLHISSTEFEIICIGNFGMNEQLGDFAASSDRNAPKILMFAILPPIWTLSSPYPFPFPRQAISSHRIRKQTQNFPKRE